jgi:uncharacterized protein (TIGR02328 family)
MHKEISGMRGDGWGQNHSTVNYVWKYQRYDLYRYHEVLLDERDRRGFGYNNKFRDPTFQNNKVGYIRDEKLLYTGPSAGYDNPIYPEHDYDYLVECIENLEGKDVDMSTARDELLDK